MAKAMNPASTAGKQIERFAADHAHVLDQPGRVGEIRSAVRVDQVELERVRDRKRDEDAPAGDERNDVRNARQQVLLVFLERFFHCACEIIWCCNHPHNGRPWSQAERCNFY
jgi:hypothetical protein